MFIFKKYIRYDFIYNKLFCKLNYSLSLFLSSANRGVLQSLIEKHFPAPDRKKLYSLLGIDLTAPSNNSSPRDSPCKENKIKKRKGGYFFFFNSIESSVNLSTWKQIYSGN